MSRSSSLFALAVLFAINAMNFFDRQILGALAEPIRTDWGLSDTQMGALGTAFIVLYAIVGVPLGRIADAGNRSRILAAGVFVWSLLTAASGLARNFTQMFVLRLGVGIGEATCAPAASSLIGDLFPPTSRARAMSFFMLGLPIGIAASYAVSGWIAHHYSWQMAFFVAGVPGILCAIGALFIREPTRGGTEGHDIGSRRRQGSPYLLVLSIPTIWWIIASGALHNFNMYAIGSWLAPFLQRVHGVDVQKAGQISMVVYGLSGIPGLFLGGWLGDAMRRGRANGRMLVGTLAILGSVPLLFYALNVPVGSTTTFMLLMGVGCSLMYVYYSTVYATIHDVIEPSLRGTAMALYFFAMYLLGAALGPVGMGYISDYFTRQSAFEAGHADPSLEVLETFRSMGLHSAMYVIPMLGTALALVLFMASTTVTKDAERLQRWMRESTEGAEAAGK